jgi:pimeloyl-ACP methyl ester carboxylesterase
MPLSTGQYYFFHDGGSKLKPPLILLPGAGADHLAWPAEFRHLPGFSIYALDLPGHGKSSGAGRQSAEEYAQAVVEFMDTAGLWRAVFVGHSMGGAVALSLALEFPKRTAGLGLISSGARLPVPAEILENAGSSPTFPFAARALQALSVGDHTSPRLAEQTLKRLLSVRPTLLHGDLLACDSFDVADRLGSIQAPVLVICGSADKLTPAHNSVTLAARIPNAALQIVDEAGHLAILEQPTRLAKILSVFLTTIPYTPGV